MQKRGRPPHPDILTPREWEVHALLREGLTNERIAERLNISLDGAKYHVSEILSKLGVSSRDEAAAWTPEERPWWARLGAWGLLAKGAGTAVVVSAASGLGLLAWGVASTGEEEVLPPANLSSDQAIAAAFQELEPLLAGDTLQEASASFITYGEAAELNGGPFPGPDSPPLPPSDTAAWLVTVKGTFFDPFPPNEVACREITMIIIDATGNSEGSGTWQGAEGCD